MKRKCCTAVFAFFLLYWPHRAAFGANLLGDSVVGAVGRATDPIGTNYFNTSIAAVGFPEFEFTGIDGDYQLAADFARDPSGFIYIRVDRIPTDTNGTPPNYRFAFSDLDFTPPMVITGVTRIDGTPGINIFDVVVGPKSAAFTIGTSFLSNGGSFGVGVRFDTVVPGDFNNNGRVDAADYVFWRKKNASQSEYNQWRTNFGQPVASGSAVQTVVPEPVALVLIAINVIGIIAVRSRRASRIDEGDSIALVARNEFRAADKTK